MFGLSKFFSKSTDQPRPPVAGSRALQVRSASQSTPPAMLNIVQGLINADVRPKRKYNGRGVPAEIKLKCARYCVETGPVCTIKKFEKDYPCYNFSLPSIGRWRTKLMTAVKLGSPVTDKIFSSGAGRPMTVDAPLLKHIKDLIVGSREAGTVILRRDVINIGHGVLLATTPSALVENGGSIHLTEKWARGVLASLNFVKRRSTTAKRKISDILYEEIKFRFQVDISILVREHNIPSSLVINLDQTPLSYVCNGRYTFDTRGISSVPIANSDDKRAITATFACSAAGHFLDIQLIYKGKTERCLPKYTFPASFDVTFNETHWANENTAVSFLENIIVPYLAEERATLGLPEDQKCLLIFDVFRGHLTENVKSYMAENNIVFVIVPNNMTHLFQPLDLTVNKFAKSVIRDCYSKYYSEEVEVQLNNGILPTDVKVDIKLLTLKPLHAKWIESIYSEMQSKRELIINGFKKAGIIDALSMDYLFQENPFVVDEDD